MKTKIFIAFIIVICSALISNFIFEYLIIRDFDSYRTGVNEDQHNWVMASIDGNYSENGWDLESLSESIHWGMMLGLDIKVLDSMGQEIIASHETMLSLSYNMKKRMEELFHVHNTEGAFKENAVIVNGKKVGTVLVRPFQKEMLREKETAFRKRAEYFLYMSLLITGIGLISMAYLLSRYLSKPVTNLKAAAERIARGDFDVRIDLRSKDEIGMLSESFNSMAGSLKKEEELRKHLMSNVAHELRTPLTIMKTQIEAVTDGVVGTEEGIENIRKENERLIRLVEGIEDITAAEASFFGKTEDTPINLKEFLSGLIREMRPAFKGKGLDIELAEKNGLIVLTDAGKLEKIVSNIISNAIKFTENGKVWIDYGTAGNEFFIDIRDSGKGIPEDKLPLIFNRYYRLEKTGSGGLGLGLAIVKELVTVLEGRVDAISTLGSGTTFRVLVPLKKQ